MANPFLQAISVSKIYPGEKRSGVHKLHLSVEQGKITAIIGESGSGKSTLLKLLYGLLTPDNGEVLFKGERLAGPEEKLIPGHDAMKMVTQHTGDLNLFAKVRDNVAAMLPNKELQTKEEKTDAVLKQLNMTSLAGKRVVDLSGGEQQRVAIARALITQPEVLLLDEPFNQVDTSFREGLQQDIRMIVKETGLTVIMVSHDPAEVLSMADELFVLRSGEIVESGHPKGLYLNPKDLYTARLLTNCNVLTKETAKQCGIKAHFSSIAIYPEWIAIGHGWGHKDWTIKQVLFKGCYEDLLLDNGSIGLRMQNNEPGKFTEGDKVNVKIKKWMGYQTP